MPVRYEPGCGRVVAAAYGDMSGDIQDEFL
ncbi:hypothetical protein MSP7336_03215 [Mycobacterium shimoidei]|jgi:hypothetical protein|uniref:Uncharacterized protein n=1 Tax=Mycobacterium shimoidei TaxID=29313 RepID=A0A375Z1J7_MYCSH|nr:hypothetical protein MSP7336_03215 [Mycobacterium shimoidei]